MTFYDRKQWKNHPPHVTFDWGDGHELARHYAGDPHRYHYTEFQKGFDAMRSGSSGKVVLTWSEQ
jgi:hypothetical protein